MITHTYKKLGEPFYKDVKLQAPLGATLIKYNERLAVECGIAQNLESSKDTPERVFSGSKVPGYFEPIAQAYAGHQFAHFNPQLGDGRAALLCEIKSPSGKVWDIQLKGSGPTYFSRGGDGKSPLGPVVREYLMSEIMHQLGVKTTRALCALETGETVYRETPLKGAVFTRLASSHLRIGSFQYFACREDKKSLELLLEFAINRHYPDCSKSQDPVVSFLKEVAFSQSDLVAHWMSLGFIHGVMNTDNMAISGETIDYGPCAFVDQFAFDKVFSYIDKRGRYRYGGQLDIARWNFVRLAESLVSLVDSNTLVAAERLNALLPDIMKVYEQNFLKRMGKKFGILNPKPSDRELIIGFLNILEKYKLDFTNSFRELTQPGSQLYSDQRFDDFREAHHKRLADEKRSLDDASSVMAEANPEYIPRNHHIEHAISLAYKADYGEFEKILKIGECPYTENENREGYLAPPSKDEIVANTFCGT